LSCYFKYMARGRIPEFESYHPSHAVVSSAVMTGVERRGTGQASSGSWMACDRAATGCDAGRLQLAARSEPRPR
jgi:hypothetical protein